MPRDVLTLHAGQEQIYEVITRIQDHLDDSTPSAYQQMIEASQLAELRKEQERKEQLRVAQEVKQMEIATLELKIQQDLNRKHALLVTPRKVSGNGSFVLGTHYA